MHQVARRALARIGALGALVVLATAVHVAVAPSEAQARCDGHTPIRSNLYHNNQVVAEEWPQSGACNSDNLYQGVFRVNLTGGWRASVWIQNGGVWRGWRCDVRTCSYQYTDSNYYSLIHLCIDNGTDFICGWGQRHTVSGNPQHTHYGENWGY